MRDEPLESRSLAIELMQGRYAPIKAIEIPDQILDAGMPGLFEQIQRQWHVTICGPTNLLAYLNSLQMGFRTMALQQRSAMFPAPLGILPLLRRQPLELWRKEPEGVQPPAAESVTQPLEAALHGRGGPRNAFGIAEESLSISNPPG